jgi:hypothetical protein
MNKLLSLMVLGLALASGGAFAASHVGAPMAGASAAKAPTAQQTRMATCNKEATGKKGDERKAFMKSCLSGDKPATQQDKMKTCNVDAKGMKGDERKKFMSGCLKK